MATQTSAKHHWLVLARGLGQTLPHAAGPRYLNCKRFGRPPRMALVDGQPGTGGVASTKGYATWYYIYIYVRILSLISTPKRESSSKTLWELEGYDKRNDDYDDYGKPLVELETHPEAPKGAANFKRNPTSAECRPKPIIPGRPWIVHCSEAAIVLTSIWKPKLRFERWNYVYEVICDEARNQSKSLNQESTIYIYIL